MFKKGCFLNHAWSMSVRSSYKWTNIIYLKKAHSWSFVKNIAVIYSCIWMNWLIAFLDSWSLQGTKKFVWSFIVQYRALPRIPWQLNAEVMWQQSCALMVWFTNCSLHFISIDMFIDISTIFMFRMQNLEALHVTDLLTSTSSFGS